MGVQIHDKLPVEANVLLRLYKDDKIVFEDYSHNVFTNEGRKWLASSHRVTAGGARLVDTLPYYIAVGTGSDQQTITPPGPGTQVESALVTALETPVEYASGLYLAELDRPTQTPDDYTNLYTRTFQETEISFGSQPSVPVTEYALVTSDANPLSPGGGGNGQVIAYRALPPVTKTGLFKLQILWELRY